MSKNNQDSTLKWLESGKPLSEYEHTDIIATLDRQEVEIRNRISLWRAILGLPLKKTKDDK